MDTVNYLFFSDSIKEIAILKHTHNKETHFQDKKAVHGDEGLWKNLTVNNIFQSMIF